MHCLTPLRRLSRIAVALLPLLATAIGCDGGPALAPVAGKVTHGGQPLAGANIIFSPEDGIAAGATTDDEGRFELVSNDGRTGAVPGQHHVSIVKSSPEAPPPTADSGPPPVASPPIEYHVDIEIPADGNTDLVFDIP